jgi:hypothetical protein
LWLLICNSFFALSAAALSFFSAASVFFLSLIAVFGLPLVCSFLAHRLEYLVARLWASFLPVPMTDIRAKLLVKLDLFDWPQTGRLENLEDKVLYLLEAIVTQCHTSLQHRLHHELGSIMGGALYIQRRVSIGNTKDMVLLNSSSLGIIIILIKQRSIVLEHAFCGINHGDVFLLSQ